MKGLGLVNIIVKFALNNKKYFGSLVHFFEACSFCNFCRLDFFQKSFASVGFVGADQVTLKYYYQIRNESYHLRKNLEIAKNL